MNKFFILVKGMLFVFVFVRSVQYVVFFLFLGRLVLFLMSCFGCDC